MTRQAATVEPSNKSNPGCMTIVNRDGSDDALEAIAALFPSLADGGYCGVLREAGGRDVLDVDIMHGGECGDEPNRWDASVWYEADRWTRADVVVERGLHRHLDRTTDEKGWAVRVVVSPHRGRSTTHLFPCSFRGYRKTNARAYIARALTAHLAAN
jgi:hypothetical protein